MTGNPTRQRRKWFTPTQVLTSILLGAIMAPGFLHLLPHMLARKRSTACDNIYVQLPQELTHQLDATTGSGGVVCDATTAVEITDCLLTKHAAELPGWAPPNDQRQRP